MNFIDTSKNPFELPFLTNVGLVVTYKCQISCPHCIIEAGPHRKEVMRTNDALNWINQIAGYGDGRIKVVSLTGGEPFYNIRSLKEVSDYADSKGLVVSAVTNAFWATSQGKAIEILRDLKSICWLTISTDIYHQVGIPIGRIKNAVLAADECNIPFSISVCTENKDDSDYKFIVAELKEFVKESKIQTSLTFQAGRAKSTSNSSYLSSEDPPIYACSAAKSPIIFPDGKVIACIGPIIDLKHNHPLVLGNLNKESLEDILDRSEQNSVLHTIRIWGPRKLISLIQDAGLGEYLPKHYIKDSICNACYDLFSNDQIIRFLDQLSNDVIYKEKVAYARVYYLNEQQMIESI